MKNLNQNNYLNSIFSPIGLLMGLTLITFSLVIQLELDSGKSVIEAIPSSLSFWQSGFFNLLAFTLQMMMILAFGYALSIFRPINKNLKRVSELPHDLVKASILVSLITMLSGLINWGFGLVIGAIFSRMVHESLVERKRKSNPELLAACGYLGMAVWHGGLSASSLLSIAEKGHSLEKQIGVIPINQTIFSYENLFFTGGLILVFTLVSGIMGKYSSTNSFIHDNLPLKYIEASHEDRLGRWIGIFILLVILSGMIFGENSGLNTISLNWVIFLLFGMTLVLYKSWGSFLKALGEGLKSTLDIFIQFPFYGGIMGLILSSGLLTSLSVFVTDISGKEFFPLFTFYSSAMVNFFIPSGGGQWVVQGPLIMNTAKILDMSYAKLALVFAHGDQITNLLQPFWALPLLAITGVSVRKLLPYCLVFFLAGIIYLSMMIWTMI